MADIDRLRVQRGWSQEQLGRRSGLTDAELRQVLDGWTMPPVERLWRIANALRVPIATLLRPLRSGL